MTPALAPAVPGLVVAGHGVASGRASESPFAGGTIALQVPHLLSRGVDLRGYHPATINVDLAPLRLHLLRPRWTVVDVEWTPVHAAETFSFVDCVLTHAGHRYAALVYHPHPETKPMHHQPATVVELLSPVVPGLGYGDAVALEVAAEQAHLTP